MNAAVINTCNYGSTGRIGRGLYKYLKSHGHNAIFCYGRGRPAHKDSFFKFSWDIEVFLHILLARMTGLEGCFSFIATFRLKKKLKKQNIDTVYLLNIHGYVLNEYHLLQFLKVSQYKVIYLMLDEYPFTGKCGFTMECSEFEKECRRCPQKRVYPKSLFFDTANYLFKKKKEAYSGFNNIIFVGIDYTVQRAKKSILLKDKSFFIADEAIDLKNVYTLRNCKILKDRLKIPEDKKIIVCVAPFSNIRKGCSYFLKAARMLEDKRDIIFVHVGFDGNPSICPSNYIPIGFISDQNELAEYYSLGDLFVFPSLAETIPSTCLQALACGTPILGFNISGMPYCADHLHGQFVEPKNAKALAEKILEAPRKTPEIKRSCRAYAESRFDEQDYFRKLVNLAETNFN